MKHLASFISLFLIIGCLAISAQQPIFPFEKNTTNKFDTLTLVNVEIHGLTKHKLNLGNAGSPFQYLLVTNESFRTNPYSTLSFLAKPKRIKYSTKKPMTFMHYVIGSKKEQYFNVFHTQNFSKNSNLFVGLDKINNVGFFQNQNVNNTHIYANYYTQSKSGKYQLAIDYDFVKHLQSLNGGLTTDTLFNKDSLNPFLLYDVNLLNASQDLKQSFYRINQRFRISKPLDSTHKKEVFIYNDISYQKNSRNFYDTIVTGSSSLNTDYYSHIYNDSLVSNDNIIYQDVATKIGIFYLNEFNNKKHYIIKANAFFSPSYNHLNRNAHNDTVVVDLNLGSNFSYSGKKYNFNFNGNYLLNDKTGQNDIEAAVKNTHIIKSTLLKVDYGVSYRRERPSLDLLSYTSNTVKWNNDFQKPEYFNAFLIAIFNKQINTDSSRTKIVGASLYANYFDNKNPIYFNFDRKPNQAGGYAQVIQTGIELNLTTSKWNIQSSSVYQYQGGLEIYRLPALWTKFDLGYKFKMFKRKMNLEAGFSLTYFSKFQSKDFDATTGQFFLSNSQEIGAYPFVDVFIKGRIQRFTYFLMSSHPHEGLFGMKYMQAPLYPGNGRMFKVGFSWLFVN